MTDTPRVVEMPEAVRVIDDWLSQNDLGMMSTNRAAHGIYAALQKAGTYCPACRGMALQDCRHTVEELRDGLSGFAPDKFKALLSDRDARIAALCEALTPSPETKAAYMGEVVLETISDDDEDGLPVSVTRYVPWTAIKDVMRMISRRALGGAGPRPMTDTRRYLTEKARRKSGEKVPQNYEGDHYDTIAARLITQWGEGLRGYQAANLQQAIANCIRNERYQQDEAIQCAAELIAAKDAEIARLREALLSIVKQYENMIWGEDHEYLEAGQKAEKIAESALSGKDFENE